MSQQVIFSCKTSHNSYILIEAGCKHVIYSSLFCWFIAETFFPLKPPQSGFSFLRMLGSLLDSPSRMQSPLWTTGTHMPFYYKKKCVEPAQTAIKFSQIEIIAHQYHISLECSSSSAGGASV